MTRFVFLFLLTAAALVSVLSPQWSRAQAAQSYYVDLVTRLRGPVTVVAAGSSVPVHADVLNLGPDPAVAARLLVATGADATLVATQGCTDSPSALLPCRLAAAVASGGTAVARFDVRPAPSARGVVVLAATADADGTELNPDNDDSVAVLAVEGRIALSARVLARNQFPNGNQALLVAVENPGPSSTAALRVDWTAVSGAVPATASCSTLGNAQCPSGGMAGRLEPGTSLLYAFAYPPFSSSTPTMSLSLAASAGDATITGGANALSVTWSDPISANGFE